MTAANGETGGTDSGTLWGDYLAFAPGWFLLLGIEPAIATFWGIPAAAGAIILRRRLWPGFRLRTRIFLGVLYPIFTLFFAAAHAFATFGPLLGALCAVGVLAGSELWNRRTATPFVARYPTATLSLFLLGTSVFSYVFLESGMTRYFTEDVLKYYAAPAEAPEWTDEQKEEAIGLARQALVSWPKVPKGCEKNAASEGPLLDAAVSAGVDVTLVAKKGLVFRGHARAGDAAASVHRAACSAVEEAGRFAARRRAWGLVGDKDEVAVIVDVSGPARREGAHPWISLAAPLFRGVDRGLKNVDPLERLLPLAMETEVGVDGLEITMEGKQPVRVLPGDPVLLGWLTPRVRGAPGKLETVMEKAWARKHREKLDLFENAVKLRKFRTTSFASGCSSCALTDLYRGNALLPPTLDKAFFVRRTALAAEWLARQVGAGRKGEPGRFRYEAHPPHRRETRSYNLPRHAGSVYGLFSVYRAAAEEPGLHLAGDRALRAGLDAWGFVSRNLGAPKGARDESLQCFLKKNGDAESGSTALAALALASMPLEEDVEDTLLRARIRKLPVESRLEGLGRCLLEMIDPKGAVFRSYRRARKRQFVVKEPLYFPGEAMLALTRIYERTKDPAILEGARAIGDRQLRKRGWMLDLDFAYPGDHWIIQGLYELARLTGETKYAELCVLYGYGYLREQLPPQAFLYPDYQGAYRRIVDLPRTTRAASRGEALAAARRAALLIGEPTDRFDKAMISGARHLLEHQYVEENGYFIPAGFDAKGAIRMGLVDNHIRIDNNQHVLVALLETLRVLE